MAEDSTLLPNVDEPPGAAPSSGDGTGTAFDYSNHFDRIVTALEQMSLSLALIHDQLNVISSNSNIMAAAQTAIMSSQSTIADSQTTIADKQTTIADKQTLIETYQKTLKELGEGAGVHIQGPYEWLSMYAIYKLLTEEGVTDFASLKAQVDSLPKQEGF